MALRRAIRHVSAPRGPDWREAGRAAKVMEDTRRPDAPRPSRSSIRSRSWLSGRFATVLACLAILAATLLAAAPIIAASGDAPPGVKVIETWIEEWDPERACWVRLHEPFAKCSAEVGRPQPEEIVYPLPRFGPFLVLNERVAGIFGIINAQSLNHFERMLGEFPDIDQLNFVDAAGTDDDIANLKLGRIIRASGIATHVPAHGSARSGAVELFLAGGRRTMERGARFAVHRWRDQTGRGPQDYPAHHPFNALYLDYYIEMGMSHDKSHAFYDMTNSVPHSDALWFGPDEMTYWLMP